jgi:hypothetical protein
VDTREKPNFSCAPFRRDFIRFLGRFGEQFRDEKLQYRPGQGCAPHLTSLQRSVGNTGKSIVSHARRRSRPAIHRPRSHPKPTAAKNYFANEQRHRRLKSLTDVRAISESDRIAGVARRPKGHSGLFLIIGTAPYGDRRHATSLNHDAYPRLRSMPAARSNSLFVGMAKSSASAYRVTILNSAHTAIASIRASVLTPA